MMSKFDRLDNKNTLEHYFLKIYYFKMSVKMKHLQICLGGEDLGWVRIEYALSFHEKSFSFIWFLNYVYL